MENKEAMDSKKDASIPDLIEKLDEARANEVSQIINRIEERETKRSGDTH